MKCPIKRNQEILELCNLAIFISLVYCFAVSLVFRLDDSRKLKAQDIFPNDSLLATR